MNNTNSILHREGFGSDEKVLQTASDSNGINNAKAISITLDEIDCFVLNPRQNINPKYEEIKESIRMIGLENPLTVTKRPGEAGFTLYNGGNTRLKALKELWNETGEDRYFYLDCRLMPYSSDSEIMIKHMIENETRGDMLLIDKANAAYKIKKLYEQETGEVLGVRPLADLLSQKGWKVNFSTISLLIFTAEKLSNAIPLALSAGMGKPKVASIRKTYNAFKKYITGKLENLDYEKVQEMYLANLTNYDAEDGVGDDYALTDTCKYIGEIYNIDRARVQFEINYITEKGKLHDLGSNSPEFNDLGQRINPETGEQELSVAGSTRENNTTGADSAFTSGSTVKNGAEMPKEVTILTGEQGLSPEALKIAQIEDAGHQINNKLRMMEIEYPYMTNYTNKSNEYPYFECNVMHVHQLIRDIKEQSDNWDFIQVAFVCEISNFLGAYFYARVEQFKRHEAKHQEYKLDEEALELCKSELHELVFDSNVGMNSVFYGFDFANEEFTKVLSIKTEFITLASLLRNYLLLAQE